MRVMHAVNVWLANCDGVSMVGRLRRIIGLDWAGNSGSGLRIAGRRAQIIISHTSMALLIVSS